MPALASFLYRSPTAADIAAGVPLPEFMAMAQCEMAELQARERSLLDEQRALSESLDTGRALKPCLQGAAAAAAQARLTEINVEWQALRKPIQERLRVIDQQRPAYGEAIASALAPMRIDAARKVVAAIDELKAALLLLKESAHEITKAGGSAINMPPAVHIDFVKDAASRIVASARK